MDVDGGVFGVDDAALVAACLAAMTIGAAIGVNRKNVHRFFEFLISSLE